MTSNFGELYNIKFIITIPFLNRDYINIWLSKVIRRHSKKRGVFSPSMLLRLNFISYRYIIYYVTFAIGTVS
jgi:hypothetical protein